MRASTGPSVAHHRRATQSGCEWLVADLRALARRPAQDRVDQPGGARRVAAGELDGLVDGGVRRDAVEVEQLEEPEPQGGAHGRVERLHGAFGELGGDVVKRAGALHRAVGELGGQRALAAVEAVGSAAQGAVGPGAVLEDAAQDGVGGPASGGSRPPAGGGGGGHHAVSL